MVKKQSRPTVKKSSAQASQAGTEARLHAACIKAGSGAALKVALERLPLLKPFIPENLRKAADALDGDTVRRELVASIYQRHGLRAARWELESVLAVAETQTVLTPLATRQGLEGMLKAWLPSALRTPLMRFTPLEPLVTATSKAVATTWAAGRYADAVCRVRKAGVDWLPAPLADALQMAPTTLRDWSAEALTLALPPLKLAAAWGQKLLNLNLRDALVVESTKPARQPRKTASKKPATKRSAKSANKRVSKTVATKPRTRRDNPD